MESRAWFSLNKTILILWSLLFSTISQASAHFNCHPGMVEIPGGTPGSCYLLRPIEDGKFIFRKARKYCEKGCGYKTFLPTPRDFSELEAITDWAIGEGLPRYRGRPDDPAGYWLGYRRKQKAPLEQPGDVYTNAVKQIREDKSLFTEYARPGYIMPDIWRNGQPGDQTDKRDERCTAQKKPGNFYFIGADDYACARRQLHYVICESPLWSRLRG
ncbi:uncharacterized protein LOC142340695 [Convolutriloba macropyga]|uniref:uncharacterized protein LOC142340695 n=1 Tax=Convolutriloba macropyga TaxID=536237 RepID=UPI003F524125